MQSVRSARGIPGRRGILSLLLRSTFLSVMLYQLNEMSSSSPLLSSPLFFSPLLSSPLFFSSLLSSPLLSSPLLSSPLLSSPLFLSHSPELIGAPVVTHDGPSGRGGWVGTPWTSTPPKNIEMGVPTPGVV
eukprot:766752-Hanusia_phi.AAC.11